LAINSLKQNNKLKDGVIILKTDHLSLSRINRVIHNDIHDNSILSAEIQKNNGTQKSKRAIQKENTKKRLEVVSLGIVQQINRPTSQ
jgi:hypothetical protein